MPLQSCRGRRRRDETRQGCPPSAFLRARLNAERARLFPNGPTKFIGVHIRNGDACSRAQVQKKKRTCDGLSAYMPAIERLARKYGIHDVLIATDGGEQVLNATHTHAKDRRGPPMSDAGEHGTAEDHRPLRLRYLHRGTPRQTTNIDGAMLHRHFVMPHEVATDTLIDTLLLAEASALVGKMTSNVFRAAFELAVAHLGGACVPPYVSLDAPWCYRGFGTIERGNFVGGTFEC